MAEFRCADAGAISCGWKAHAESEDELLGKVKEHLEHKHKVQHVTETLKKYALSVARKDA
jgi:predicted small metal-binding protein